MRGSPIDVGTVRESLDEPDEVGGLSYLGELAKNTLSVANILTYAAIVHKRSHLRRLVMLGYGTASMLAWMVEEKDIEPHVPVWDKTERKNDSFSSNDFHWNEKA